MRSNGFGPDCADPVSRLDLGLSKQPIWSHNISYNSVCKSKTNHLEWYSMLCFAWYILIPGWYVTNYNFVFALSNLVSYVTIPNVTYHGNLCVPDLLYLCYVWSMRPGCNSPFLCGSIIKDLVDWFSCKHPNRPITIYGQKQFYRVPCLPTTLLILTRMLSCLFIAHTSLFSSPARPYQPLITL